MFLGIVSLTCLFTTSFFIQPTICPLPTNIQNVELDDITSLWNQFPLMIEKIKETVSRFRCPKGWKRLGGSCYYLSNYTSISSNVNHTCNRLHSNSSNLMQIRHAVELFYAAHVLSTNGLTTLIIDIHPDLLKGKRITDILKNDQDRWNRMKQTLRGARVKYQNLTKRIITRLNSAGLKILRRSRRIKPHRLNHSATSTSTGVQIGDEDDDYDDEDDYEYDDFESSDESDDFEEMNDIRGLCDQVHWNVLDDNATSYILSTYSVSDKMICSLSDVESDSDYHYVCEYVIDFCFASIVCGTHGHCVNTLSGFKCTCAFLYGGLLCEKISEHGQQIIASIVIIICMTIMSIKQVRWLIWKIIKQLIRCCKSNFKRSRRRNHTTIDDTQQLILLKRPDKNDKIIDAAHLQQVNQALTLKQRRPTMAQEILQFFTPRTPNPLLNPIKRNLVRNIWVGFLSVFFLSTLFIITTLMYLISSGYYLTDDTDGEFSINDTLKLVTQCEQISNYRMENLVFTPFAITLIFIFSWSIKRENLCLERCEGRPGLLPPIEPFRTENRFTTATVFGILAFEVLKIFEELLFRTGQPLPHGVLFELLVRIAIIIVVGLRYYPVLASLQLRNVVSRFFICLYIFCDMAFTIVREGSCMGFLSLSGQYTALEEAKLRKELGTWFIIYGLIKNIPHFFFLSYLTAELCVRFVYDSIYVSWKKKKSIWFAPVVQSDELEFFKYYVTKLFRRNLRPVSRATLRKATMTNLNDYEQETEKENKPNQSRLKKLLGWIYHWDDDFRFTTIATCTYSVAIVFLYYLACTFVFLYISRTTGHISFITSYIEASANVELKDKFSLRTEIILSAIVTVIIYGFQLFVGMQNYKKHKAQLYQGLYVEIPSADNFKKTTIASNSVHYSGFLVGYMAWGFVICFHLILLIFIGIRVLSLQLQHVELVLGIIVPVLVIYLIKMLGIASVGKSLFIGKLDDKLNLKSRKSYAILVYFSFFADCFLGIASCFIRLIKASLLNLLFMARLDHSFLGRPLEKFDVGFAAYVSYLHMEVTYTNPIMLAFCYSLYDDIVKQRSNHYYDDECCIGPGELDNDDERENPRQNRRSSTLSLPSIRFRRRNNDEQLRQISSDTTDNESKSQTKVKHHAQDSSISEIILTTDSKNTAKKNTNQTILSSKRNVQQLNTTFERQLIGAKNLTSLIPQQQLPVGPAPQVPPRGDIPTDGKGSGAETDDGTKEQVIPDVSDSRTFHTVNMLIASKQSVLNTQPEKERLGSIETATGAKSTTAHSLPLYHSSTTPPNSHLSQSTSYFQVEHSAPPIIPPRSDIYSSIHRRDNTDNNQDDSDSSHYSELPPGTFRPVIRENEYSTIQPNRSKTLGEEDQQPLNEHNTDGEEEGHMESNFLIPSVQPLSNTSRPILTANHENSSDADVEKKRLIRKKQIRFRWHFLYTLINNYHLFDLRKEVQNRLARLHIQSSSILDGQLRTAIATDLPATEDEIVTPQGYTDAYTPLDRQPPPFRRFVSMPIHIMNEYPQSPAERYVAIRAQMIYDVNAQLPNIPHPLPTPQTPTSNQQQQTARATDLSVQSLGFPLQYDATVYPPPQSSADLATRQASIYEMSRTSEQQNLTPSHYQPTRVSNVSTADYPLTASSMTSPSTFCTQMSHEQHMKAWRKDEVKKIEKKQRYCYVYGRPPQPPIVDKVSTATILISQILSTAPRQQQAPSISNDGKTLRKPTMSPFHYLVAADRTLSAPVSRIRDNHSKPNHPPQPMDRLDEGSSEISNRNQSQTTTSIVQVHQIASPSSSSTSNSDIAND